MRALMFADWCVLRGYLPQYAAPILVISAVVGLGGSAVGGSPVGPEVLLASMTCFSAMFTMYCMMGCFGVDGQGGWERGRLELLPVTAPDVVRARYLVVLCVAAASIVLGAVVGAACTAAVAVFNGVAVELALPAEALTATVGMLCAFAVLISLQMVVFFVLGLERGRAVALLPVVLLCLLAFEPVRDALTPAIEAVGGLLAEAPWPATCAAFVVAAAVVFAASMAISCRAYSAREL